MASSGAVLLGDRWLAGLKVATEVPTDLAHIRPKHVAQEFRIARREREKRTAHVDRPVSGLREDTQLGDQRREFQARSERTQRFDREAAAKREEAAADHDRLIEVLDRAGNARFANETAPITVRAVKAAAGRIEKEAISYLKPSGSSRTLCRESHSSLTQDPCKPFSVAEDENVRTACELHAHQA
jgi:hypothetical protein